MPDRKYTPAEKVVIVLILLSCVIIVAIFTIKFDHSSQIFPSLYKHNLSATTKIISYEAFGNMLKVDYELKNTGDVDIDYYEIYLLVRCKDGATIGDWTNGLTVLQGTTRSAFTIINVDYSRVARVEVGRMILRNNKYGLELNTQ